jgi:hypothetical protein
VFYHAATAKFKPPVFKLKSSATGLYMTAGATGQPITIEAAKDDPTQKW